MSEDGTRAEIPKEEVRKINEGEKIVLKNLRKLLDTISGHCEHAAEMLTDLKEPELGHHFSHECDEAINEIFGEMNLLEMDDE
jgi:hypothetical protein